MASSSEFTSILYSSSLLEILSSRVQQDSVHVPLITVCQLCDFYRGIFAHPVLQSTAPTKDIEKFASGVVEMANSFLISKFGPPSLPRSIEKMPHHTADAAAAMNVSFVDTASGHQYFSEEYAKEGD